MNFAFSDDQRLFESAVRDLLDKECSPEAVRAAWAADGRVAGLWARLADMGVVGLTAPAAAGGMGATMVDLVLLIEAAGRAALPDALVDVTAVALPLLPDADAARVAAGALTASAVLPGAAYVPDADLFTDGLRVATRDDVALTAHPTIDGGRRLVAAPWDASPSEALAAAFDRGALGSAAMLCGLSERIIDMTAAYAIEREQFGKPIGSYQAVKHHLANARLKLEFARPAVYAAALSMEARSVSAAKVLAADAGSVAARVGLQVHGAIGYTWEHDLHLWMKPVWTWSRAYGDARWHRSRVATLLGLT